MERTWFFGGLRHLFGLSLALGLTYGPHCCASITSMAQNRRSAHGVSGGLLLICAEL
ncbi:hypothetical protein Z946_3430 [Sulfitobacter noctilucicola]|nr:hypothetical protein Z946_3430 [Sulfitobacter noctilucicola]